MTTMNAETTGEDTMIELEEFAADASQTLHTMIDLLLLDNSVSVEQMPNGKPKLNVTTSNAGRLIGRKGQALESLELLLNRIMKCRNEENPWIPVEVDGYSTGRTGSPEQHFGSIDVERFKSIANDAAKEVKRWGAEKRLGPYMPGERKVIHTTLKDDPEVETESIPADSPKMKYVIVRKKQA